MAPARRSRGSASTVVARAKAKERTAAAAIPVPAVLAAFFGSFAPRLNAIADENRQRGYKQNEGVANGNGGDADGADGLADQNAIDNRADSHEKQACDDRQRESDERLRDALAQSCVFELVQRWCLSFNKPTRAPCSRHAALSGSLHCFVQAFRQSLSSRVVL